MLAFEGPSQMLYSHSSGSRHAFQVITAHAGAREYACAAAELMTRKLLKCLKKIIFQAITPDGRVDIRGDSGHRELTGVKEDEANGAWPASLRLAASRARDQ